MTQAENLWSHFRSEANAAKRAKDYRAAADLYERAIANANSTDCPANDLAILMNSRADLYLQTGDLERALSLALEAVEFGRRRLTLDSPVRANDMLFLARVYEEKGDLSEALRVAGEGLQMYEFAYGPSHAEVGVVAEYIGSLRFRAEAMVHP